MPHSETQARRRPTGDLWVVKIGSSMLTSEGRLRPQGAAQWVRQIALLQQREERRFILVSSGAIAAGMARLDWPRRPSRTRQLQAAAAVGQAALIQSYQRCFARYGTQSAQILLTHDDFSNRRRYRNAHATLQTLLNLGICPVVNENDTVATEELCYGDNDRLAAAVANLSQARLLVILTDQEGLHERNPQLDPKAPLVRSCYADDATLNAMAGDSMQPETGRGGMETKLAAARMVAQSGIDTVICRGNMRNVLLRIAAGDIPGTLLKARTTTHRGRKRWLASRMHLEGSVQLDEGAVRSLRNQGGSLLAAGVTGVSGNFSRGALVACLGAQGQEIARGLVNYSATEVLRIKGLRSAHISSVLDGAAARALIHRDNLIITAAEALKDP